MLQEECEHEQISVWNEGSKQTTTEDFISNDLTRAIRINVCAPIEKFRGDLEIIDNDHGLTQNIQIHEFFCDLPGEPVV
jgi:hypothetical protein